MVTDAKARPEARSRSPRKAALNGQGADSLLDGFSAEEIFGDRSCKTGFTYDDLI